MLTRRPMRLWRRFQYWRALRIYARAQAMAREAERLVAIADRLIGENIKPPMPLMDWADREGR